MSTSKHWTVGPKILPVVYDMAILRNIDVSCMIRKPLSSIIFPIFLMSDLSTGGGWLNATLNTLWGSVIPCLSAFCFDDAMHGRDMLHTLQLPCLCCRALVVYPPLPCMYGTLHFGLGIYRPFSLSLHLKVSERGLT